MASSRGTQLLRGAAGASVATFVALLSHVGAGGEMPALLGVAVPWILSLMVCTLLAGRRLSAVRLSLAVVSSQALFHVLFVLGAVQALPTGGGHHHSLEPIVLASGTAGDRLVADPLMWAGHALAAVATVLILHRGEAEILRGLQLVRDLARCAVRRLVAFLDAPQEFPAPRVAAPRRDDDLRPLVLVVSSLRRRGPPALA
ncbi:hypothetical protein [Microbacterium sp. gxy059]|uniref:hypothetical protein n=1 Tax=Microbacterium sp. gxy059 TaxID=2957199 RepID=UPI003D96F23F